MARSVRERALLERKLLVDRERALLRCDREMMGAVRETRRASSLVEFAEPSASP